MNRLVASLPTYRGGVLELARQRLAGSSSVPQASVTAARSILVDKATRGIAPVNAIPRAGGSGGRISVASVPGLGTGPILLDAPAVPRTPKPMQPAAPAQPAVAPEVARSVGGALPTSQLLAGSPSTGYSIGKTLGILLLLAVILFLVVRRLEL